MTASPGVNLESRFERAKQQLEAIDQAHVLNFFDQLDAEQQDQLLKQVESVDWPEVARLIQSHVLSKPHFDLPGQGVEPAPWYPYDPPAELIKKYDQARALGDDLLRQGRVAAFTVAGGQGTRLGWDGPKGTFPATPVRHLPLFGCFAEYIHNVQDRYGAAVPWYVMTSPVNDAATRQFFQQHDYFGLDRDNVMLFPQGMMPAMDAASGKVLLADKDQIALSPNGHGGSLKALYTSGALADMNQRGIEHISYTQVDNPLVRMVDPLFLGLHAIDQAQMSSKMLPKAFPKEKLGNFCLIDGKMTVIEYSDLPDELAQQRLDDGQLRFRAGSIAIHAIRVDFVQKLNEGAAGFSLPWHRAEKKVACIDAGTSQDIKPSQPNAVKLETFVFDALPLTDNSIVYETHREDEFAPIKNADEFDANGEPNVVDCPATSKQLQIARAARWLVSQGVDVPLDSSGRPAALIEISQRTAIYPQDLAAVDLPMVIAPGDEVLL